jgi:hypothetical protein
LLDTEFFGFIADLIPVFIVEFLKLLNILLSLGEIGFVKLADLSEELVEVEGFDA